MADIDKTMLILTGWQNNANLKWVWL